MTDDDLLAANRSDLMREYGIAVAAMCFEASALLAEFHSRMFGGKFDDGDEHLVAIEIRDEIRALATRFAENSNPKDKTP